MNYPCHSVSFNILYILVVNFIIDYTIVLLGMVFYIIDGSIGGGFQLLEFYDKTLWTWSFIGRRTLITVSLPLLVMRVLRFSNSSSVSFCKLHFQILFPVWQHTLFYI